MRPCLSQPGDGSRFRDVDLVIVRENTEDLYAGIEFDEGADVKATMQNVLSACKKVEDDCEIFGI